MGAIKLGQTSGHVKQTAFSNRVYNKPSLRKAVIRHPGVLRRSERVLGRNEAVRASPPAAKCGKKGPGGTATPWDEFITCLSEQMPKGLAAGKKK
jgi:hypothetical protein